MLVVVADFDYFDADDYSVVDVAVVGDASVAGVVGLR